MHQSSSLKRVALLLSPLLALMLMGVLDLRGFASSAVWTAGVTALCALWWITEALPIPVTSLIPLAVLPLCGVLKQDEVARAYGSPLILLLLGGFILSTAMERSGAHRRLALTLVRWVGGSSPRRVVMGFLFASAAISMWISNTATALMLLPVALAVLEHRDDPGLASALLLSVAYGSSIGGIGTPVGTPPNLIFMQVYERTRGTAPTFLEWMMWGVPVVVLFTPLAGWWLTRRLAREGRFELPEPGPWRADERRVLVVFGVTALLWITRTEPLGGWSTWLGLKGASDASVALLAVLAMFLIPDGKGGRLLDWASANRIPWGILLLFSGGIAIADAFEKSGLSTELGTMLGGLAGAPTVLVIATIALGVTFLTEVTSNTATATLLMPVLAAAGASAGLDPALLMVPAAMSASCAFMLPVATAPNAIVFGTGRFPIGDMVRAGLALNLIGVLVITAVCFFLV